MSEEASTHAVCALMTTEGDKGEIRRMMQTGVGGTCNGTGLLSYVFEQANCRGLWSMQPGASVHGSTACTPQPGALRARANIHGHACEAVRLRVY